MGVIRVGQRRWLVWFLYGVYEVAAITVLLHFVYTPVPPEGRSPFWVVVGLPLLLPGLVLSFPVLEVFGFAPGPSKEAFAAVTTLGCLGAPLIVAWMVRGWVSRWPRQGPRKSNGNND